jgi:hypothetical protein
MPNRNIFPTNYLQILKAIVVVYIQLKQLAADLNVQLSKTDDINTSSLDFGICGTVPNGMKKVRLCFFSPITFPRNGM